MSFGKIMGKDDKAPSGGQPAPINVSAITAHSQDRTRSDAFLGKGSKVSGNLHFSGPVEIGGQVEGEIVAQERIIISDSAEINAKIVGVEIIIHGKVTGDIQASKKLSLRKPARVNGNISSANLSIEEGVVFEGKCSMVVPESADSKKAEQQAKPVAAVKAGTI